MQWMSLQWMSLESMSLQWMSLQWMSLQWMSLQWMSLQWMSLERMSLQWMPLQWMSLQWMSLERASLQWTDCRCNGCHCNWQLLVFDWILPRKLRFHIVNLHFWEKSRTKASLLRPQFPVFVEASHESFALHLQLFRFLTEGKPHTKASFSHSQLSLFEGSLARIRFEKWRSAKCCTLQQRKVCRATVARRSRVCRVMLGSFSAWPGNATATSGVVLETWSCQFLKEVSHESFVFTSSTFRFWLKSCTKASFSHRQLSVFIEVSHETSCFHIVNFQLLAEVSHESFVFTSSTFSFWLKSLTKA